MAGLCCRSGMTHLQVIYQLNCYHLNIIITNELSEYQTISFSAIQIIN